jgi:hypothetical protein
MDVTEKVIDDILFQCKNKGFLIMPQLAAFIAKSLVLNKKFGSNHTVSPSLIQELIQTAVVKLTNTDSPSMETIKLQVAVVNARQQLKSVRDKEERNRATKGDQLIKTIVSLEDDSKVFGEIGLYILHQTKRLVLVDEKEQTMQEIALTEQTEKEIFNCLENVIPRQYMHKFVAKTVEDKKLQLKDLWKIVWGMVLYNKYQGQGGQGVEAIEQVVPSLLHSKSNELETEIIESNDLCNRYRDFLNSNELEDKRFKRLRSELTNKVQYNTFLREIQDGVKRLNRKLEEIVQFYSNHLSEIQKMEQKEETLRSDLYVCMIFICIY